MAAAKERWRLLAKACTTKGGREGKSTPSEAQESLHSVSRVAAGSFGFVKRRAIEENVIRNRCEHGDGLDQLPAVGDLHQLVCYSVKGPAGKTVEIILRQRKAGSISLADHRASQTCGVDSTGVVCLWPAEEVMTHYCTQQPELFRGKRVIELGSGYGLAGLAVAACTDACEVVLTDGNPQVLEAIRYNVQLNAHLFGVTTVRSQPLTWGDDASLRTVDGPFDVIIAADCTFFKDYHAQLAGTIKSLLDRPPVPGTYSAAKRSAGELVGNQPVASSSPLCQTVPSSSVEHIELASSLHHSKDEVGTSESFHDSESGLLDKQIAGIQQQLGTRSICPESPDCRAEDGCQDDHASTQAEWIKLEGEARCDYSEAAGPAREQDPPDGKVLDWDVKPSEPLALLFNPQRGGTLNMFVEVATQIGLRAEVKESFDYHLDEKNERFKGGECSDWPGYTEEHCRPKLLILRC